MSKILAIMGRELRAYFYSPVGYIVIAVFLVLSGILFGLMDFDANRPAEMRNALFWMTAVLVVLVPVVTMRLVSEEMSRGTIESLMTAPVTDLQVILGKFLSAVAFYFVLLLPTLSYPLVLAIFADPDWGPIISGYLGLVLIGVLFLSISLMVSCLTRSQIVSAFVPFVFLGTMTFLCHLLSFQVRGLPRDFLRYIGFLTRYENFGKGILSLNDVVFFLSLTVLALFLSVKILESRKWRGAHT